MTRGAGPAARVSAEAAARRSYGKLVAFLSARTRDVAAAEDALSEAFAAALADWPRTGCPSNPEAWLLTVARRKLIDSSRRRLAGEAAAPRLQLLADELQAAATATPDIPDQRLALMFACAHPAIEAGVRAPLILQVVLGLDAATIASAFLTSPAAMGKRLVRAKDHIRQAAPSPSLNATSCGAAWPPCWTPSTPPSPRAGPTRAEPMSPAATSPRKPPISPGWSLTSCRGSPRRWASLP